ncbi:hypothetical protein NliqN6_5110 [Naganishia liquefaciens]|uniref:Uncharacterized protein n=1 Tax=Naganishia liquefaciens TaxID=104408 RepID=A0A8H3TX48_9TREE|nr:hypothetical protein NliqN6_5110 [Naganishia liquefaciens]
MHLNALILGAIALSKLARSSPIPTSDAPSTDLQARETVNPDCAELPVMVVNSAIKLWDQVPTRYDMARSLRANDDFKELAGVADAITNVRPDWIPGTVFQASTAFYKNGTSRESNAYKPLIQVERDNLKKVHVPVLKLFGNKDPVYLTDYTFELVGDGSTVVWYHALQQAFHVPIVQQRLASINPNYTATDLTTEDDKIYKVMAKMEMLTGETPQQMRYNDFPWKSDGGELNVVPGFDPLSYSPTVLYTTDKKLRPITRSQRDKYLLLDCRVYGPGEDGTPVDKADDLLDLDQLTDQTYWGIRLPFQAPVEGDFPLLKVAPPTVNTDAYLSHSSSS